MKTGTRLLLTAAANVIVLSVIMSIFIDIETVTKIVTFILITYLWKKAIQKIWDSE